MNEVKIKYINKFIDKESNYFKKNLEKNINSSSTYEGYLWNCLNNAHTIKYHTAIEKILQIERIIIFSDNNKYFNTRFDRNAYDFKKLDINFDFVIKINGNEITNYLNKLPEDIYVCDENYNWSIIFTHEYVNQEMFCLFLDNR